jgi:hypothetical protein
MFLHNPYSHEPFMGFSGVMKAMMGGYAEGKETWYSKHRSRYVREGNTLELVRSLRHIEYDNGEWKET